MEIDRNNMFLSTKLLEAHKEEKRLVEARQFERKAARGKLVLGLLMNPEIGGYAEDVFGGCRVTVEAMPAKGRSKIDSQHPHAYALTGFFPLKQTISFSGQAEIATVISGNFSAVEPVELGEMPEAFNPTIAMIELAVKDKGNGALTNQVMAIFNHEDYAPETGATGFKLSEFYEDGSPSLSLREFGKVMYYDALLEVLEVSASAAGIDVPRV